MVKDHPCYNEHAKKSVTRVHLPVIKGCNINCGYCNRLYSCPNENRPGVTAKIIKPEDCLAVVQSAVEKFSSLPVVGIAGPGEALFEPEVVYKTFKSIAEQFPSAKFCLSTNGYNLVESIELIKELNIKFITVTVNTVDPLIAEKIYFDCDVDKLIKNQIAGIKLLSEIGVSVKVNTVAVTGINMGSIVDVSKIAAKNGAYAHNIMPFYPVLGSMFEKIPAPSQELIKNIRTESSLYLKQLSHCNRCRADAVGYLS